ncbi:SLC13 family permease [Rhodopila sp.]|uniref:SLC13 family permease n=1 Tax=Rhodopila sp. TaxID=2480087 RepID=UPI003D14F6BC
MTLHQIESFAIVAGMLGLFMSDRLRYDMVAALALSCAAFAGIVPRAKVFEGFSNPVVIIIASVLVLGRAVSASGVVEASMRRLLTRLRTTSLQIGVLTACVTFLSAFIKNVGTLGIFMPIAIQTAERGKRPASLYLMPLAFGSLVGGTITQIGTSPNLLISAVRQETQGRPFTLFDFTPVGLPLSIMAVGFLAVGWRLIPRGRTGRASAERRLEIEKYTSEARLPAGSPLVDKTVGELEALSDGDVVVSAIIREGHRRYIPARHWTLYAGDLLILQGDPVTLKPVIDQGGLELLGAVALPKTGSKDDQLEAAEAVIIEGSLLIGQTLEKLSLRQRFEVNVLALGRSGQRISNRLRETRFQVGDTIVVQGRQATLAEVLSQLGCLPLAERHLVLGQKRPRLLPIGIVAATMGLIATHLVATETAFFVAAVLVVLFGALSPKQAYDAVDWPIVVMLGCLIPVGEALKETGAAGPMADALTVVAAHLPGALAVGLILLVSMLVTPFLHHAAAVLVMGPVAASVAGNLGYRPDAFLMAVALGASCDFLTPVGHQNNLLVMAPGGYRFSDYWRMGLPLSCLVAGLGTWLIVHAWPLH